MFNNLIIGGVSANNSQNIHPQIRRGLNYNYLKGGEICKEGCVLCLVFDYFKMIGKKSGEKQSTFNINW